MRRGRNYWRYNQPRYGGYMYQERLNDAFKDLRAMEFIARQNFACCSNCAGYEIASYISNKIDSGKKTIYDFSGCVFYHHQDNSNKILGHEFYLRFGEVDVSKHGTTGLSTVEVGRIVCKQLTFRRVPHYWDGDPWKSILIINEPIYRSRRARAEMYETDHYMMSH